MVLPIRLNLIGILLRASLGVLVVSTSSLWWRKMVCLGKSSISSCIAYAPSSLLLAEWKVSLQDYRRRKHGEKPVICLYSWICWGFFKKKPFWNSFAMAIFRTSLKLSEIGKWHDYESKLNKVCSNPQRLQQWPQIYIWGSNLSDICELLLYFIVM